MKDDPAGQRRGRRRELWGAYQRVRYAILFYVLLFTLLAMAVVTALGLPAFLVRILVGASVLAAVMPNASKRTRQVLFAGVMLLILAQFAPAEGVLSDMSVYARAFIALTGLVAAAGALRFVIRARSVGHEAIYAALSTYLLAGTFFGQVYWLVETVHPKSVVGPDPFSEFNAVYYSFITLATLGYGDFVPRTAITRGLATFEVIGGQLFLAVLVARLIGAFAADEAER